MVTSARTGVELPTVITIEIPGQKRASNSENNQIGVYKNFLSESFRPERRLKAPHGYLWLGSEVVAASRIQVEESPNWQHKNFRSESFRPERRPRDTHGYLRLGHATC